MTKNCIVMVKGIQKMVSDPGEPEPIELITVGRYDMKDGRHVIEYDEVFEGLPGKTHNIVNIDIGSVTVSKTGQVNTDMLFEVGRINMAAYETPYGLLDMSFETTAVNFEKTDRGFQLNIAYKMSVGGQLSADCRLELNIKFRVKKKKS